VADKYGRGDQECIYYSSLSLPETAVISDIRAAVRNIDPNLAVADMHAMGELVTQAIARRRFQTTLLAVFSGIAMLLAVVGVYGLLAYSVKQRSGKLESGWRSVQPRSV
jgi:hypothetical protein